jgi:hypothetical protein
MTRFVDYLDDAIESCSLWWACPKLCGGFYLITQLIAFEIFIDFSIEN